MDTPVSNVPLNDNSESQKWNSNLEGNALGNSHARRFKNAQGNAWLEELPKKGRTYFRDQRKIFEDGGLLDIAKQFRESEPGTPVTEEMKKLQLGFLVPPIPRPVFTKMVETEADIKGALYSDDRFCLFLNRELPYPECYAATGKFSSAGCSLVHMLACPIERIYNAVNLRNTDTEILEHMKNTVLDLMTREDFKDKCLEQLDAKMTPALVEVSSSSPNLATEYEIDKESFRATGPDQMRFYFHVHPNHSVGHLHMHCLQNNLRTSFIHEHKNTKYDDIMAVLK